MRYSDEVERMVFEGCPCSMCGEPATCLVQVADDDWDPACNHCAPCDKHDTCGCERCPVVPHPTGTRIEIRV